MTAGWLLYDGECGFCKKWVGFWKPALERHGFEVAPLQEPWVAQKLGMPLSELLRDVRLLTASGQLYSGADAYLYAARQIWWAWPFGQLFRLPGLHGLLEAGYRYVARNRYCISGQCRVG